MITYLQLLAIYLAVGGLLAIIAVRNDRGVDWILIAMIFFMWLPVAAFIAITGKDFSNENN